MVMKWSQKQVSTAIVKSGVAYAKVTLSRYNKEELLMRAKAHNWEILNNGKAWRLISPKDKTIPRSTNGGCGGSDWVPDQLWVCAIVPTGDDIADDERCQEIGHYVDNPNSSTWVDQPPCDYPPPPSDCELYGFGCGGEEPDPGDGDGCMCNEQPPTEIPPQQYDCDCSCEGSSPEMADANTIYEPKWGQLGSRVDIVDEVKYAQQGYPSNHTLEYQLEQQRNYFEGNRMWTRDSVTKELVEAPESVAINRYVYTANDGWIDVHHLFYTAYLSEKYKNGQDAIALTSMAEWVQWMKGNESAFSYEDKPSNQAGVEFWFQYKGRLRDGTMTMDQAINEFLISKNAKLPSEAPNYDYIPHVVDNKYPKNFSHKGLTGEELKQKAKEAYCKKTTQQQNNIKEAHQKLPASSPKKN